jgi:isopentenyl-diphosphate delta-isomerase
MGPPDDVVLVNRHDRAVGRADKMAVHRGRGLLHRAFSVFVFNAAGRLLIQRRAGGKYHFAGLWANTCCSHPRPGEPVGRAAHRRLREEMGFDCPLRRLFTFIYRADSRCGLCEHELDHVWVGAYEGPVRPDPREVGAWKWVTPSVLLKDLERRPDAFAPWFSQVVRRVLRHHRSCSLALREKE